MTDTAAEYSDGLSTVIGRLYAVWTMDCLVEISYAVSVDFIVRPQLYLGDSIPDSITRLRMSWGTDVAFPNTAQRQAMMLPVFGRSDAAALDASSTTAPFPVARKKLVDAVIAFSERTTDNGIPMLLERVRSALVPLRAHFAALGQDGTRAGRSLALTARQMQPISETAISILAASDVAKVFSVNAADARWPFDSTDPNGAKLVENVGAQMSLPPDCKLGYTKFVLLQRVAQEGAQALSLVFSLDPAVETDLLALISQVYTWGTSLRDYQQTA